MSAGTYLHCSMKCLAESGRRWPRRRWGLGDDLTTGEDPQRQWSGQTMVTAGEKRHLCPPEAQLQGVG